MKKQHNIEDEAPEAVNLSVSKENTNEIITQKRWELRYGVEIPLLVILFAATMGALPSSNLIMYRTCVHSLGYSVDTCRSFLEPHLNNHTKELENEVQQYSMAVSMVQSIIEGIGPAVLGFFMGAWADRHGRKPLLVWASSGIALGGILMAIYTVVEALGPWWCIVPGLPNMLTGSVQVFATGAMCIITDVVPMNSKSLRLLLIHLGIAVGTAGGSLLSPYLMRAVGIVPLMFIRAGIFVCASLYTVLVIEESLKSSTPGSIFTIFDWERVKDIKRACFTKKPNNGRLIVLLVTLVSCLNAFTLYGTSGLGYMYVRTKVNWTMQDYTKYNAVTNAINFVGSIVGIGVIQKLLKISDLSFTAFAFFTNVVEHIILGLATLSWQMYLGGAISVFKSVTNPLLQSFLSQVVGREDTAKVFGLLGSANSIAPLVSPLLYSALYSATLNTFPGGIMLLTAGVFAICFCLVLFVQYLKNKAGQAAPPV